MIILKQKCSFLLINCLLKQMWILIKQIQNLLNHNYKVKIHITHEIITRYEKDKCDY